MKKNVYNFNDFISEELTQDRTFSGEININREDFIWNEVMIWLMDQMKSANIKFKSRNYGSTIDFENPGGITLRCNSERERYQETSTMNFSIEQDVIFSYRIQSCHFTNREGFKIAYKSEAFRNYSVSGANINGKWVTLGFRNYRDLNLKRDVWRSLIDSGEYLKHDILLQKVEVVNYENNKYVGSSELSYTEVVNLPQYIINIFKKNVAFKSFIKGENKDKLKSKIANKSLKSGLTLDNVVNFLESTKVKRENTYLNSVGPYATTGTDRFIDSFDISKLQLKYPDTNKFIMDNIQDIFKGLQNKKYSHSLGYYTFKDADITGAYLNINASRTTYYN